MKNLWWAASNKDDLIISDMYAYVHAKNKKRWWWRCCCCCKKERDTCDISINKRSKKTNNTMVVVSVISQTEIKEWLHYYALCASATRHGAQLLLSL